MYDSWSVRWQNPDKTACTAAAAQIMLNLIAHQADQRNVAVDSPNGRLNFRWTPDNTYFEQETILQYERTHMTMLESSAGSDPHGWRNAVNYFGWGTTEAGVYADRSYSSFNEAVHRVVASVARYGKPAGILARSGGHAQVISGYVAFGQDPRLGDDFQILGIYVTDPLESAAMQDTYVTLEDLQSGTATIQFAPYTQTDSPYLDPIDGEIGANEWYRKWVVIEAQK